MGDTRFVPAYERVHAAANRLAALRALTDEEVVAALAGASLKADPLVANVLATEALNRLATSRRVLDSIVEGVIGLDRNGNVTTLNRAAEAALGRLREEVAGRPLSDALPGVDRGVLARLLEPLRSGLEVRAQGALSVGGPALRFTAAPVLVAAGPAGAVVTFERRAV